MIADGVQRDNWHKNMSYQPQCIWRTALNFLVAQAPQCEWCKSRGLCPSCLLYEDKTCIFRTLLVLWKGHRLVWNIKQLMLSEIKRTLKEWEASKRLWWYVSLNLQQIWRNEEVKRLQQRASDRRRRGRGYSSIWILHIIIPPRVLLLKCQDFWLKRKIDRW